LLAEPILSKTGGEEQGAPAISSSKKDFVAHLEDGTLYAHLAEQSVVLVGGRDQRWTLLKDRRGDIRTGNPVVRARSMTRGKRKIRRGSSLGQMGRGKAASYIACCRNLGDDGSAKRGGRNQATWVTHAARRRWRRFLSLLRGGVTTLAACSFTKRKRRTATKERGPTGSGEEVAVSSSISS